MSIYQYIQTSFTDSLTITEGALVITSTHNSTNAGKFTTETYGDDYQGWTVDADQAWDEVLSSTMLDFGQTVFFQQRDMTNPIIVQGNHAVLLNFDSVIEITSSLQDIEARTVKEYHYREEGPGNEYKKKTDVTFFILNNVAICYTHDVSVEEVSSARNIVDSKAALTGTLYIERNNAAAYSR